MGETTSEIRSEESAGTAPSDAAQIRLQIDQTRAGMSETLGALTDKLDPVRITEQVKEQIREKASEAFDKAKSSVREATIGRAEKIMSSVTEVVSGVTGQAGDLVKDSGSTVITYIRKNPIAFALVGIGVGMLTVKAQRHQPVHAETGNEQGVANGGGFGDKISGAAQATKETIGSAASSVRDVFGNATDSARKQIHDVTDKAKQGTQAASSRYKKALEENPMAVGVVALAAGVAVALTIPATRIEGEYMGETRERVVSQATSTVQETAEKIQHIASEAGHAAKSAAEKEGLLGDAAGTPKSH